MRSIIIEQCLDCTYEDKKTDEYPCNVCRIVPAHNTEFKRKGAI